MTFHDLFQFSMTLVSAVTFKNFHNCYCFWWYFLPAYLITYLYPFSTPVLTGLGILYMRRRALGRDWSLSYFVLALTSAVTNLPNITPVFHHSRCLTIKYYDFLGLENEILKFLDFPGFSMTCASPATHMLISSSKRTRRCGLERGTSKLSFPKYVNF